MMTHRQAYASWHVILLFYFEKKIGIGSRSDLLEANCLILLGALLIVSFLHFHFLFGAVSNSSLEREQLKDATRERLANLHACA